MSLMPVEYVNPFFLAAQRICSDTLKVDVTAGKPRLHKVDERVWKLFQISAVIQLGNAVRGLICMSFTEAVALTLASGLAQENFKQLNAASRDALGEVANLIIGTAKRDLPGALITITPPKILPTYQVQFPIGLPHLILPFETSVGRFVMQLAMSSADPIKKNVAA